MRRRTLRRSTLAVALPVVLPVVLAVSAGSTGCGARADRAIPDGGDTASTEILWDTWGVPHVFAPDAAGLLYGYGWSQARNHADLVLRLLGTARGRAAEYWGEEHLASDRWVWTVGIPGRAAAWLARQDAEVRVQLDAFAAGFNDYAERHRQAIADDVEVVLPISAADLLAHTHRAVHFTFVTNPLQIAAAEERLLPAGSNAWAIGPERAAGGAPLLVANPHLPWGDLFTWFEVQLVGPDIDVYGAGLVGTPFIGIGFNEFLGWTHTVNTHDGADLYELALEGDGYRYDGQVRPFETTTVELAVRGEDGTLRPEHLEIRRSVHGPVVAVEGDRALALAVVGLDAAELHRQYWDMARARSLTEFEAAMRRLQMPMFTFMYADRDGNILHHFGGETPIRPRGDWRTWSGTVAGDSSTWLWTGIHPFDDLPTTVNPVSGWLQNANDPPWTTTFPVALEADDFPAYMAPRFMHLRAQRSARMIAEDESVTFDEAVGYKLSSRMELADRILDDLAVAVAEHGDEAARRAIDVLGAWDRAATAESRGAVLFVAFVQEMEAAGQSLETPHPATGFATAWSDDDPRATPDGLADPEAAAAALGRAAEAVEGRHGALDVAWGGVYRLRRNGHDHPAGGAPGSFGVFRVVNYMPGEDGVPTAGGGDSWISVVEFADPLRARVLLTYGNASQPGSPHNGDQLSLFAQDRLRTPWRTRREIERHLELREALEPPGREPQPKASSG